MSTFHFKQFSIVQKRSAMKVGTDAMLLGSLSGNQKHQAVLDVGAGTGVIALMLAQRFPSASLTAIELNNEAFQEARENVSSSPFSDRVRCVYGDFAEFKSEKRFDLIVSNPPFFINDLKNEDPSRTAARHADALSPGRFLEKATSLLTDNGIVEVIIPHDLRELWVNEAERSGLFLQRVIEIKGKESGAPNRDVLRFGFNAGSLEIQSFTVRRDDGGYTKDYVQLTAAFHDRVPR